MKTKMIILLLTLITFICSGCSKKPEEQNVEAEKTITTVKGETVITSTLYETCSTNGNIRVEKSVDIFPVMSGRVVSSPVKMGQPVLKDDVIAVIDPSIDGGNYSLCNITSPIAGNILTIPVQTGTVVNPETRIAVVGDISELLIIAHIPERFYSYLKTGIKADISVETYKDEIFEATVRSISPVIDEESRTIEIILTFDKKNPKICAGMFADITLYLKAYKNVLSVPAECISERSGEMFIYKAENSHAKLTKITTGITLNNRTTVLDGLKPGETIISEGFETLTDNEEINLITE